MCLMLYLATPRPLAGAPPSPLQIRVVDQNVQRTLRATLTMPHVSVVTIDGCSCGFPSFGGHGPVEYFDGLLGSEAERAEGAAYVRALLELIGSAVHEGETAEVFPVWIGQEAAAPAGRTETALDAIEPETFWFVESRVHALHT